MRHDIDKARQTCRQPEHHQTNEQRGERVPHRTQISMQVTKSCYIRCVTEGSIPPVVTRSTVRYGSLILQGPNNKTEP